MATARRTVVDLMNRVRDALDHRTVAVEFAGRVLHLEPRWRHERDYLEYIERETLRGPLAIDVWTFSHFVRPRDVTLDAGANIGFTALLAERAGAAEVHCFEPDPRLVDRLARNVGNGSVRIHPVALGEQSGIRTLWLSSEHNQGSTANRDVVHRFPHVFRTVESVQVEVQALDDLFRDKRFDFFKIDVEGSELAVLMGAERLLRVSPPQTIYVESYDESFGSLYEFLSPYYPFVYRIVCDRQGRGRLFRLGCDPERFSDDAHFTMPPSYICSSVPRADLTGAWTAPLLPTPLARPRPLPV
jgi:FkbM family methyltransferase